MHQRGFFKWKNVKTGLKSSGSKKITRIRLQNIALYYLQRFDTSVHKLREVLQKRVNEYARYDKNFDRREADGWIEELLAKFESCHYLDDRRFAENKIRGYLAAGKPRRYIENKLREKGIAAGVIEQCFDEAEYDPRETALNFARKKSLAVFGKMRKNGEKCGKKIWEQWCVPVLTMIWF